MTTFHCHNCGCVTDLSDTLQAFEQNPHCPKCGMSVSESDSKMQDELADMLNRNMHFGVQPAMHDMTNPPTPQVVPQSAPITYISQHYHHSAHLVPMPLGVDEQLPVSTILRNAGVNTDALLPSQLSLFRNAPTDQRNRLIELWRIAPPTYGSQLATSEMVNWPQTNLEMEEVAARQRYERTEQERFRNLSVLPSQDRGSNAEPYMSNGYDADMAMDGDKVPEYRPATDPVHNREREWWHMAEEPIEHQYGMLQQWRMVHGL